MRARKPLTALAALCCTAAAFLPATASAAPTPQPAWAITLTPMPSNFAAGTVRTPQYLILATNVGAADTDGTTTVVKATLPPGLKPVNPSAEDTDPRAAEEKLACKVEAVQTIVCETDELIGPGRVIKAETEVEVEGSAKGTLNAEASVSGGGAPEVATSFPTEVKAEPLPFGFLPGFQAILNDEAGEPLTQAGSHPYQQTLAFSLPTQGFGVDMSNAGHARDIYVELPRGMVGSPAASPRLCSEVQLSGAKGCPLQSQVGIVNFTTLVGNKNVGIASNNLYNMVPPPGAVAELATDLADGGIFVHILVGLRSDEDYGIEAATHDVLALGTEPIFGVQAQVWGDPSGDAHDLIRGDCPAGEPEDCEVEPWETPLLTMPGECPHEALPFELRADSWEEPSHEVKALEETPEVTGCEELQFEPSIGSQPTTNRTDSPSGLNFALHQPTEEPHPEPLEGHATATLKDAVVHFPAGLAINPAQASGLGACSESQIGFEGEEEGGGGQGTLFFSKAPQSCPDAAKVGSFEATSPALVARTDDEEHAIEEDPEGNPVLEVLKGSVYVASPFANPFKSLIAVYLVLEDEKTGIVAKLAGKGELDPTTGQITTRFRESPELPIEDIRVHLFGGARGVFTTPPTCGTYTTNTELSAWSAPGESVAPADSFQTSAAPGGGPCPQSLAQMPSAPGLDAGTLSPAAGKYSPLIFKVSREDGTQRLGRIEATLPTGLSAKLAGVALCSEADIAKARSREAPQMGAAEQADPSCPASSQVGIVNAGAGSGPTPYYTQGRAYLAGPYKGAPVSIVAIAPAVAGPFDLGTVVVRSAVYLDPVTAQARVLSDPLPQIIDGIPLDLRSVAVRAERPEFSLNPTSCEEKSFGGSILSALGQATPISERFQVGGCRSLPFKPKLTVRLKGKTHRGGNPSLRSVFTAKPGEANTARISFALPKSEFIDQAHFRTICTRVQYAAGQCPAGSVYGHVRAFSPLLDHPLEGPVYLRSPSNKLPDVILALRGPPSQPIALDVAGRVDSVHGGLRVRFEAVPDAPLTKAVVQMQGGKKGLFQNSTNICKGNFFATAKLTAQSGTPLTLRPKVIADCPNSSKKG
ncbi:MAG TPA: hypothetical protein VG816_13950, partial [Solirubrobacterales bacterium]|nr:hypothetical protein [Solirubrobacterales bacterium]